MLHTIFQIPSFRQHQESIIRHTMQQRDCFVLMRTGGGKSLTYQLPALLERPKVTLVVSPLLSLIQDQVQQMNQFCPGTALSFTSGIGASEHAQRWKQVRDPHAGVCLVFVTPEKVHQSPKLKHELELLHQQNRLARFVIDECHCACQWGHDFRPDYTKLGSLKAHFPTVPVLCLTATASDRVRQDVCQLLRLDRPVVFQSSANRPNLTYSVVPKLPGTPVVAAMASFIQTKYPNSPGIVYTLSRKDADTVAHELCLAGVTAQAYHSDVNKTQKQAVHRRWMQNDTQVVVATIAFGLGINKPDVRFVLHHCLSKTLEAYYQESGRAGRDGRSPTDCVLYYSPKDVWRVWKMIHGTRGAELVWPMIRYGQQSGNDAVCRATLLTHLEAASRSASAEKNPQHLCAALRQHEGTTTTRRPVGPHAQTLVQIVRHKTAVEQVSVTPAMLVKEWRMKPANALPCVQKNPPAKDGLTVDDCERIIVALVLEDILQMQPKWTAYDTIIYVVLGPLGERLADSTDPKVTISLPIHKKDQAAAKSGEWLSAKPKRKSKTTNKTTTASKTKKAKPAAQRSKKPPAAAKQRPAAAAHELIELSSDDDDDPVTRHDDDDDALWQDEEESEEEFEFEG